MMSGGMAQSQHRPGSLSLYWSCIQTKADFREHGTLPDNLCLRSFLLKALPVLQVKKVEGEIWVYEANLSDIGQV